MGATSPSGRWKSGWDREQQEREKRFFKGCLVTILVLLVLLMLFVYGLLISLNDINPAMGVNR
jgi:hypothetical protein